MAKVNKTEMKNRKLYSKNIMAQQAKALRKRMQYFTIRETMTEDAKKVALHVRWLDSQAELTAKI